MPGTADDIKAIGHCTEFLSTIFGRKPSDAYLLAWTLPNRRSYWYADLNAAAQSIVNWMDRDVYIGAGLSAKDYGPSLRCKAQEIIGITALWADIDILSESHKKKNLPPDEEVAIALLRTIEVPYSVLVHSGHGLQAWWLLEHPWMFLNSDDWKAAQDFLYQWSDTIRSRAHALGYDVDSTPDLSRVMRMVGTINNKNRGDPKDVIMLESYPDRVYTTEDFLPHLVDPKLRTFARPSESAPNSLRLRTDASPPFDKWEALKLAEPRAIQSWERKRKDLRDQSASAYDYSLASFAVMAKWTDQEICDLLLASRRMHGDDLKLRESYYQMTIQKARKSIELSRAREVLDEIVITRVEERIDHAPVPEDEESEISRHAAVLQNISVQLGIKIVRITRTLTADPEFDIHLEEGKIELGSIENLTSQTRLRNRIAQSALKYIRKFKSSEWDRIAEAMLSTVEDIDVGVEATETGLTRSWLERYLAERHIYTDVRMAAEQYYPFERGGDIYLFSTDFREWVNQHRENMSTKALGIALRNFGCTPDMINVDGLGRRTTRGVWRIPPGLLFAIYQGTNDEEDEDEDEELEHELSNGAGELFESRRGS